MSEIEKLKQEVKENTKSQGKVMAAILADLKQVSKRLEEQEAVNKFLMNKVKTLQRKNKKS